MISRGYLRLSMKRTFDGNEQPPDIFWRRLGGDVDAHDSDVFHSVMIEQGDRPFVEDDQFLFDVGERIVDSMGSVASGVASNSISNGFFGAVERHNQTNADDYVNALGLTDMPREAVEEDDVSFTDFILFNEGFQDFLCDGEMSVLQQRARSERMEDDVPFLLSQGWQVHFSFADPAEVRPEIEMDATSAPQSALLEKLTERRFAGTGRADDEDGFVSLGFHDSRNFCSTLFTFSFIVCSRSVRVPTRMFVEIRGAPIS